jgi:transposase
VWALADHLALPVSCLLPEHHLYERHVRRKSLQRTEMLDLGCDTMTRGAQPREAGQSGWPTRGNTGKRKANTSSWGMQTLFFNPEVNVAAGEE